MSIERWNPFEEAVSLRDAVNSLFQDSFVRPGSAPARASGSATFPLDVCETENEFVVKASLPGMKPDDVQVTIHGDTLSIRGESKFEEEKKGEHWHVRERRSGAFQRALSLGTPVDADKAQAQFEHGVLTLRIPKSEAAKPKLIKVAAAGPAQGGQDKSHK